MIPNGWRAALSSGRAALMGRSRGVSLPRSDRSNIAGWIAGDQFASLPDPLGRSGFTLPDLRGAQLQPLPGGGSDNWLILCGNRPQPGTKIAVQNNASGNVVVLGCGAKHPSSITINGSSNLAIFGDDITWPLRIDLRFSSSSGVFYFGREGSSNGSEIILEGDGCNVLIGDDCMLAADTSVRTSDLHAIRDAKTKEWLNAPSSVLVEPHVWIGHGAMVTKGVSIGGGSVIGAQSLVNRSVPPAVIAGGTPARVLRDGIEWTRERDWK